MRALAYGTLIAALLAACAAPDDGATASASAASAASRAASASASAPVASQAPPRDASPATWKTGIGPRIDTLGLPDGPRPAIRSDTVSAAMGADLHVAARLFVAHVTREDGVWVALRFGAVDGPIRDRKHRLYDRRIDWRDVLAAIEVSIEPPAGPTIVLQLERAAESAMVALDQVQVLRISAAGIEWARAASDPWTSQLAEVVRSPWKKPAAELFARPGRYQLRLAGMLEVNGEKLPFRVPDLELELLEKSARFQPAAAVAIVATAELNRILRPRPTIGTDGPPFKLAPFAPAVEDVAGNLWLRYQLESGALDSKVLEYNDALVVDAVVDRAGKLVSARAFKHFSCVAEGTPIATPDGATLIERLRVGDRVLAYDREAQRTVGTVVEHVRRVAVLRDLHAIGALRLTAEHPVFAAGAFHRADELPAGAPLLSLSAETVSGPARPTGERGVVYELAVGPPHVYFAAGILVHNKSVGFVVGGGAPWRGLFERPSD